MPSNAAGLFLSVSGEPPPHDPSMLLEATPRACRGGPGDEPQPADAEVFAVVAEHEKKRRWLARICFAYIMGIYIYISSSSILYGKVMRKIGRNVNDELRCHGPHDVAGTTGIRGGCGVQLHIMAW